MSRTFTPLSASQRLEPRPVQLAERDERQLHLVALAVAEEAVDEHLAGVADVHPVEPLVQGRDEHRGPVPLDRPIGLPVAAEPGLRTARPARSGPVEREPGEPVGDAEPLHERQIIGPEEAPRQVQRRRQRPGLERRISPLGREEEDARLAAEEVGRADAPAEVGEVRAAGHAHVLAVIDELAGRGVGERAGPPAEPGPALEERDVAGPSPPARRRPRAPRGRRRRSRPAAARASTNGLTGPPRRIGSAAPASVIAAFLQPGIRTRPDSTS